ncbi:hypothetical protein [Shuttleworthella satelles]|uniref:Uncharacterized protein n=1 Tax=Shuttleworthella satelles DSM 14600 TaxID=626523 RepID=C4GCI2_9FIRM|nr:hypothetical protein [Shuttleworthia satelles]EEP27682.1 hypothetical protein GCWU000342_01676 [Shuttleworthia satelles DSM 14600]
MAYGKPEYAIYSTKRSLLQKKKAAAILHMQAGANENRASAFIISICNCKKRPSRESDLSGRRWISGEEAILQG